MRVVVAGASGFLGSRLRASLAADGHRLTQLVRRTTTRDDERWWDPYAGTVDASILTGADAVINLAGAGVGDKRWNDAYRRVLLDSRVQPTTTLATALASLPEKDRPSVLVNASAVGYYGDTGDATVDEQSAAGGGFFPTLCESWEAATGAATAAGIRVVLLRSGLVLDGGGGLLRPLALATRLLAGGPMGGGRQWMPWISAADWVGAVRFLLAHADIAGPVNVVGPDPVRNKDFAHALGKVLHRPAPWPIPTWALRIAIGEFADESVTSQRALPAVLSRAGYEYQHSTVESALHAALGR